jgi:hypothetical protein
MSSIHVFCCLRERCVFTKKLLGELVHNMLYFFFLFRDISEDRVKLHIEPQYTLKKLAYL